MTLALVTNDDGIDSPGLHALARLAADLGLEVLVAAPTRESSGASASLGAVEEGGRIVVEPRQIDALSDLRVLAVRAAPAFIVRAALHGAFGPEPNLVLSGINQGANTGHAVLHSGTAGAAMTANTYGRSSLAVSLATTGNQSRWATAVAMARPVVHWLLAAEAPVVLNLNVPNVAPEAVRGLRRAGLAPFGTVQAKVTEIGRGYVHIEYSEIDPVREPDSDAGLLAHGWAVVTALKPLCEDRHVELAGLPLTP
ncbi:MAG: 5'/3'-nucleotidase SurE [Acidimicrobiales bacterium]